MKYKPTIVTDPLQWEDREDITIGVQGDTFFISVTPEIDQTLYLGDAPVVEDKVTGRAWLDLQYQDIVAIVTEGESFDIKVHINKVHDVDMYLDVTIDYEVSKAPSYIRQSPETNDTRAVDYKNLFFSASSVDDHDIINPTYRLVIPAGSLSASVAVNTVDDKTLTGGKGFFRVMNISLTNIEFPDTYMLYPNMLEGSVLIEDSSEYPSWSGEVELWGKLHPLLDYEPLIDPDTSYTTKIAFGYDEDGSMVRTKIVDDVPLHSIQLRPNNTELPTDNNEEDPIDLTNILPLYRAIVQTGRRD